MPQSVERLGHGVGGGVELSSTMTDVPGVTSPLATSMIELSMVECRSLPTMAEILPPSSVTGY